MSTLILNAYDAKGELVAQGDPGSLKVLLKNVKSDDAKNYTVAFQNGDGVLSPKVAVPTPTQ